MAEEAPIAISSFWATTPCSCPRIHDNQIDFLGDEFLDLGEFPHHVSSGIDRNQVDALPGRLHLHGFADRDHVRVLETEECGAYHLFSASRDCIGETKDGDSQGADKVHGSAWK
jgi:hypothetical protein